MNRLLAKLYFYGELVRRFGTRIFMYWRVHSGSPFRSFFHFSHRSEFYKKSNILKGTIALLTGICLVSCSHGVEGNHQMSSETRPLSGFSAVNIDQAVQAVIVPSDTSQVTVMTDANLLPYLKTEVVDGTLYVNSGNMVLHPSQTLSVDIETPSLASITAMGKSQVVARHLRLTDLILAVDGESQVLVTGQTRDLKVMGADRGTLDATDLRVQNADVTLIDQSQASVHVKQTLNAHLANQSQLSYTGKPVITSVVSDEAKLVPLTK